MPSPVDGSEHDERTVFVSYARADEKQAKAVIACLEQAGFTTWWDGLIPGGDRFSARIAKALEQSSAVVVLWSRHSLESNWVQDEAAWGRDRQRLVPLSLDGSEAPLGFRQLQCLDISRGGAKADNPQMQRALAAIAELVGREPALAAARQTSPLLTRRAAIAGGGVIAIAAAGVGVWRWKEGGSTAANTVAVLPFANLGGDPAKEYLADGLAAELRATLSRNADLRVVGQASSNSVHGADDDAKTIARRLDVANLLEGNVLAAGGMVRIAVDLIDGSSGFSRWSKKFERPIDDVLKLQDDIAQAIDSALTLRMSGMNTATQAGGGTHNARAFDAYLRAKDLFDSQADEASDRAALAAFGQAIALDSHYAAAYAGRARSLTVIANAYEQSADGRRQIYAEAVAEARSAVADAPRFAEGYAALGYALFYGMLDIAAAEGPYEKARQYGSGSADVLGLYAVYNARRRRFDRALPAIDRAISLDPINPNLFKNRGRIGFASGDYDGATTGARRALELNPDIGGAHGDIGNALLMQGKKAEALAEFGKEKVDLLAIPGRAIAALRAGQRDSADRAFAELVQSQGDNGLYQQAEILAQAGKADEALTALEKAQGEQDSGLVYLATDPFLEPLRDQPRFKTLLQRLHFD